MRPKVQRRPQIRSSMNRRTLPTVRARRWKKGESDFRMRDAFWANPMKHSKAVLTILFCTTAVIGYGQTPPAGTQPDNTKVNQRDRNANEATAGQQKANETDQELTRQIRRS